MAPNPGNPSTGSRFRDTLENIGLSLDPNSYNRPYAPGAAVLVGSALNTFGNVTSLERQRKKAAKDQADQAAIEAKLGVPLSFYASSPAEVQRRIAEKAGFITPDGKDQPIDWLPGKPTLNDITNKGLAPQPEKPPIFGPMPLGSDIVPTPGSPGTPPVSPGLTGKERQDAILNNMGIPIPTAPETALQTSQRNLNEQGLANMKAGKTRSGGIPGGMEGDATPIMDDPTLRMTALMYAKTGQLPPMGMGRTGAVLRTKILTYAAHNFPHLDVATNKADYAKNQKALSALQLSYDQVTAFENTAHANADVMLTAIQGIPETGTRFGNKIGRYLASQAGSPEVAQFQTALETVRPEFNRLLQSPLNAASGTQISDAARQDMKHVLSGDFTKAQLVGSLAVLKQDAANRRAAISNQLDTIRARIAWNQSGANPNINVGAQQGQLGQTAPQAQGGDIEYNFDAEGNLIPKGQ